MMRESSFEATWKAMRQGMFALMTPVIDIGARGLRGDDHVDAGGARLLRDAGDGAFDIGGRGLHEVGQFVHDDDDVVDACRG